MSADLKRSPGVAMYISLNSQNTDLQMEQFVSSGKGLLPAG